MQNFRALGAPPLVPENSPPLQISGYAPATAYNQAKLSNCLRRWRLVATFRQLAQIVDDVKFGLHRVASHQSQRNLSCTVRVVLSTHHFFANSDILTQKINRCQQKAKKSREFDYLNFLLTLLD